MFFTVSGDSFIRNNLQDFSDNNLPASQVFTVFDSSSSTIHIADTQYGNTVIPTAIAAAPSILTAARYTDSFILKLGDVSMIEIPLSLLFIDSDTTFSGTGNKLYLRFNATKWFPEIPLPPPAPIQFSLRSGTPFSIQLQYTIEAGPQPVTGSPPFCQTASVYTYSKQSQDPSSSQFDFTPAFTGITKGYLIEGDIAQLNSLQITLSNKVNSTTYSRFYDASCLLTDVYRIAYMPLSNRNCIWIPLNPSQSTVSTTDISASFIGAMNQSNYEINFKFNFKTTQEWLRIHSIEYDLINYNSQSSMFGGPVN